MIFNNEITNKKDRLQSVKNVKIDDIYRIYFLIKKHKEHKLESLSYTKNGKNFYLIDDGVQTKFHNKKSVYIYLMERFGSFE